jgi:hypothetical protein
MLCNIFAAQNYYFDVNNKSKKAAGTFSNPFAKLDQLAHLQLKPGDSVLLAKGAVFKGWVKFQNISGTRKQPIVVSSYQPKGAKTSRNNATIDAAGKSSAVCIENCSFIEIQHLNLTANAGGLTDSLGIGKEIMRCGVLVQTTAKGNYEHIQLSHLEIKDVFYEEKGFVRDAKEVRSANGTQNYGWGIRFVNNTNGAELKDLNITNCLVQNVSHTGIKFTSKNKTIKNVLVANNQVVKTGGPGIQLSGVENGNFSHNVVDHSGSNDDSRKWGRGSGLWTWGCSNVIIEHNQFLNANGPGDSAGAHIDYNCNNIILQYNLSVNNAGGFCEILGNNYNCAYRYNVSVNDGYRVKGQNGAFQEGKTFWLSGYIGKDKPQGPFNSYFYNNTIYVKNEIAAKVTVAKSTKGVCMVNNIFMFEGDSREVEGDQFVADKKGNVIIPNVIFENNLYLSESNWPKTTLIQDAKPMYGNPQFFKAGGLQISDYKPLNVSLIKDKGIEIPTIPTDSIGLFIGLKVEKDILGQTIKGHPDMGAIEIYGSTLNCVDLYETNL